MVKRLVVLLGPGEDFSRAQLRRAIGGDVVKLSGIIHCKGPKVWVSLFWPVDGGMNHHGACSVGNNSDAPLSCAILVVSSNARVIDALLSLLKSRNKLI
jgi:hypothetical protein